MSLTYGIKLNMILSKVLEILIISIVITNWHVRTEYTIKNEVQVISGGFTGGYGKIIAIRNVDTIFLGDDVYIYIYERYNSTSQFYLVQNLTIPEAEMKDGKCFQYFLGTITTTVDGYLFALFECVNSDNIILVYTEKNAKWKYELKLTGEGNFFGPINVFLRHCFRSPIVRECKYIQHRNI